MSKATTIAELITTANQNFDKMWKLINSFSQEQQEQNFTYNKDELTAKDGAAHWKRDNNIRDILVHLYEWHQLLLIWVNDNMQGNEKSFLPKGITWTNYQKMNMDFFEKHQNTPYVKSIQMIMDSHKKVLDLINQFNDEKLFVKKYFSWTGTTSLAQYCHSATVAHYDWAIKKLKAYQKALNS